MVVTQFSRITDATIEQASWNPSKVRDKLRRDIDAHVASVRAAKLSELTTLYEVSFILFLLCGKSYKSVYFSTNTKKCKYKNSKPSSNSIGF